MLPQELVKKVKRIEINTRKIIDNAMSGRYRSHFKGAGMQFSEHRQYELGDDVRHIDWKVSARSRDPVIKKYEEERELTVLLLVDVSGSAAFGSKNKLKSEVVAEIGSMLAFAAVQTGDKVGAILFSDEVKQIIPPKKGKQHVWRIVRDLLEYESEHEETHIGKALEAAGRIMKHEGIVFLISDFMDSNYDLEFKRIARKHDLVSVWISDLREQELPQKGFVDFVDPETGKTSVVNLGSASFREWFEKNQTETQERVEKLFKTSQSEFFKVDSTEDYGEAVVQFFRKRGRRK